MAPLTNTANVQRCFQGLTIETNNIAFKITYPDGQETKIGLNGTND